MAGEKQTEPAVDLAAENAQLKKRIAELEAKQKQQAADEALIAEKMARGLSREQAISVIRRQREFDAVKQAEAEKAAAKKAAAKPAKAK